MACRCVSWSLAGKGDSRGFHCLHATRLVLRLWASAFSAFWPQHAGDCFVHFVEIQGIYIYLLETSGVVHLCGPALAQVGLWDGRLCEKRFPQVVPAAGFLCNFTVDIRVLACLHLPTVGSWGNLTPNLSGSIWWQCPS